MCMVTADSEAVITPNWKPPKRPPKVEQIFFLIAAYSNKYYMWVKTNRLQLCETKWESPQT